jgi:hypothetical protein
MFVSAWQQPRIQGGAASEQSCLSEALARFASSQSGEHGFLVRFFHRRTTHTTRVRGGFGAGSPVYLDLTTAMRVRTDVALSFGYFAIHGVSPVRDVAILTDVLSQSSWLLLVVRSTLLMR